MNINEQLTCKYCNEIFNEPVTLNCCGENICKRHIDEFLSSNEKKTFACPFCNLENANQHFSINKLIQTLIENQLQEFEIDSNYKVRFNSLKVEITKLETLLKDPKNVIYDEMHELKRLVDLDRERLKLEIDTLADDFIQQIESYEKKFNSEYQTQVDLEHYQALVNSAKKHLAECERYFNSFSTKNKERDEKSVKSEKVINKLKSKILEFKEKLFANLLITYTPMENKIQDFFGNLMVKVGLNFNLFFPYVNNLG